jgi:hypothetical protein
MASKWLAAFRAEEDPHSPPSPRADSANSADSSTTASKSEDFRHGRPSKPCDDPPVPIAADRANSSATAPERGPIGTNGTYWHSHLDQGVAGAEPAENRPTRPPCRANGTIGTNGTGVTPQRRDGTDAGPADEEARRAVALAGRLADLSDRLERIRPPRLYGDELDGLRERCRDAADAGDRLEATSENPQLGHRAAAADELPADRRDDFDERAAVAEFDAGLPRVAAERLALAEAPGPVGDAVEDWRAWMTARYRSRLARGWFEADARSATWSEAEGAWHRRGALPVDLDHCAGCGVLMLDHPGMPLPDGARVHLDDHHGLDCLAAYGRQWRGLARAALIGLGIDDGNIFTRGEAP